MLKSAGIASLKISLSHGEDNRAQLGSPEAAEVEGEAASKLAATAAEQKVNGRTVAGRKRGAGRPRGTERQDKLPRAPGKGLLEAVQGGTRNRSARLGDFKIDMLMTVSVDIHSLVMASWRSGNYFNSDQECRRVLASGLYELRRLNLFLQQL